jgi:hypothetical protein
MCRPESKEVRRERILKEGFAMDWKCGVCGRVAKGAEMVAKYYDGELVLICRGCQLEEVMGGEE